MELFHKMELYLNFKAFQSHTLINMVYWLKLQIDP